jgi:N-acetylglucosamine kinase-like BadF-type ATPase
LADAIMAQLGVSSPREMLNRLQPLHASRLDRVAIAALAPLVIVAAETGEAAAEEILDRGAGELAEKAVAVLRRLGTGTPPALRLAAAGGLLENHEEYFERVGAAVSHHLPDVVLEPPQLSPVAGAVLLALEMAGVAPSADIVQRVRGGLITRPA